MPCMCGDSQCPSCGLAQGTYDKHGIDVVDENEANDISEEDMSDIPTYQCTICSLAPLLEDEGASCVKCLRFFCLECVDDGELKFETLTCHSCSTGVVDDEETFEVSALSRDIETEEDD